MKKTYSANISGKIYNIDEDAYELLQKYFSQLRASFPGDEGREIVSDIEARVAEIFDDRLAAGQHVITIDDVNSVIARMGRPEQLSDSPEAAGDEPELPFLNINLPKNKRLYRDTRNKVFGGVVSGLASYLGWDCTIMRLLLVVLAVCSYVWPLVIVYLLAWMIIPPARTSRQILEMQGRPVTVDGVGRTVLGGEATPPPFNQASSVAGASEPECARDGGGFWSFLSVVFGILAKCAMILLLVLGVVVGVSAVIFLVLGIATMVLGIGYGDFILASNLNLALSPRPLLYQTWTIVLAALVAVVPCVALVWTACTSLFGSKGASSGVIITAIVVEVLLIAALVVMFNLAQGYHAICMAGAMLPVSLA